MTFGHHCGPMRLTMVPCWPGSSPRRTGLPGHVAIPELAVRSSLSGEFKRTRERLRGGGAGWLGPIHDPLAINGEPGADDAIPAILLPREVSFQRLERRAALLSILEGQRGGSFQASRSHGELHRQAVALTGSASREKNQVFSLES